MLSVVIPTLNRRGKLLETLASLARQEPPAGGVEVIVVDNGSSDGTPAAVSPLVDGYPYPLELLEESKPGPAAARNTGAAASRGEVVLFLGDDTIPAGRGLLAGHASRHADNGPDDAVLGRASWDRAETVTPMMEWLERGGIQFSFEDLARGSVPASRYFCTANVSLKREMLERVGGFDERFPYAAVEDVEIGWRLEQAGLRLEYRPELLVWHSHPITLEASLTRLHKIGRVAALLHQVCPEQGDEVMRRPRWWKRTLLGAADPLWRLLASRRSPTRLRETGWRALHMRSFARGYALGPPGPGPAG